MVNYTEWFSIVREVAISKGANLEGAGTQSENQALAQVAGEIWNDRKAQLESASRSKARSIAEKEISVT